MNHFQSIIYNHLYILFHSMSVMSQKSFRAAKGQKPNRKQSAFRIQGLFRSYRARNRVKQIIRAIYVKKYDVESDKFYYENTPFCCSLELGGSRLPKLCASAAWCVRCVARTSSQGFQPGISRLRGERPTALPLG